MEEEKTVKPEQIITELKALGKQCVSSNPDIQNLRKSVMQYKDRSRKRPAPSFLRKRVNLLGPSPSKRRGKYELPEEESGNLSPRIFRRQKPAAEKTKIHRGRPSCQRDADDQPTNGKVRINKLLKGFEGYLDLVSYLYCGYLPSSASAKEEELDEKEGKGGYRLSTLDQLMSPLRADLAFEKWSPKEVVLFECGICKYGKDFAKIHELVETKSVQETIEFFYNWKKTSHYKQWKQHVLEERAHDKYDWVFLNQL